jgi:hypothetical protein
MEKTSTCAICGVGEEVATLQSRPLVPREHFEDGTFSIDPLGTGGAEIAICEHCSALIGKTLLGSADLDELTKAIGLHREAFAPSGPTEERAARLRLWYRAIHLGLRAVVAELTERPPAPPARPEPDQLGLFASKTARLSKVEAAMRAGDLRGALELAQEVVRRYDLAEARYLAGRLGPILGTIESASTPDEIARLAEHPEQLLEPARANVSLVSALGSGLRKLAEEAAASHS